MHRILVVVEEENVVKTLQERFSRSEFEISSAHDGRQGFQIAQDKTPDLIIVDALIPVMSAFELCKAIKSDESIKNIPIIVLTEQNRMEEAFLFLGVKDFLNKPVNMDKLEAAVKNKLQWSQMMQYQKTKILINGSPEILSSCQDLLKKMPQWIGYYSYDSDSFLQDAIKYAPDVIFMDLLMPQVPADEMIKKFKSIPALDNTIILTYYVPSPMAHDHFAIRAQMIAVQYMKSTTEEAGAKEYLGPFNPNLFLDLINIYRKDFEP